MAEANANLLQWAAELSAYSTTLQQVSASLATIAQSLTSEAAEIAEERARLIKIAEDAAKANHVNVGVNVGVGGCIHTRHPLCGACASQGADPPVESAVSAIGAPPASNTAGSGAGNGRGSGWGPGDNVHASFNVNWGSPIGKR
ncbi:hypothetical protein P280DRAFT_512718 [Massarina eburnea CBS 473.64]|uniref:Uncharacterized protein n=1 Tax=Massarina eburnea CBS 473.64 TaxID=1395130 RepID=A0A6A6SJI1_9PLEO|nr:hypothetical protein P280DRAFT_512718 [Massarina eburnea CBS 473.64]